MLKQQEQVIIIWIWSGKSKDLLEKYKLQTSVKHGGLDQIPFNA